MERIKPIVICIFLLVVNSNSYSQLGYLIDRALPISHDFYELGKERYFFDDEDDFNSTHSNSRVLINSIDYGLYFKQWKDGRPVYDISRLKYTSYVILPVFLNSFSLKAGYRKCLFTTFAEFDNNRYFNQVYNNNEIFFSLASELPLRQTKISLQVSGKNQDKGLGFYFSGKSRIIESVNIAFGYQTTRKVHPFSIAFGDDEIMTDFPVRNNNYFVNVWGQIDEKISGNIHISKSVLSDDLRHPEDGYEIFSSGSSLNFQTGLNARILPGLSFEANSKHIRVDENIDFYDEANKFGHFGTVELDITDLLTSLTYQWDNYYTVKVSFNETKSNLYVRGHFDSWPFTDLLEQMLGSKVYIKTRAAFTNKNMNIFICRNSGKYFNPGLSAGYFRFYPDGKLTSWNPGFLGFSKMNTQILQDKIKYADAIKIGLSLNWNIKNISFAYSVQQFIPVAISKDYDNNVVDEPTQPTTNENTSSFGGSFHRLIVEIGF